MAGWALVYVFFFSESIQLFTRSPLYRLHNMFSFVLNKAHKGYSIGNPEGRTEEKPKIKMCGEGSATKIMWGVVGEKNMWGVVKFPAFRISNGIALRERS